jgi:hypothetical protein
MPSLMGSWVWVSPVHSPTGFMAMFYYLQFLDSPNLQGQITIFVSPQNRVAQIYPHFYGIKTLHYSEM